MNAIMDFYGYYGTESALTEKRGFIKDLFTKVRRSSILSGGKENSFVKYSKDLENLSTENLKQEPTKLNYSYEDVMEMFEWLKGLDAKKLEDVVDKYLEPMRKRYDDLFKMKAKEYERIKFGTGAFAASAILGIPASIWVGKNLRYLGGFEKVIMYVIIVGIATSVLPTLVHDKSEGFNKIDEVTKDLRDQSLKILKDNKVKLENVRSEIKNCMPKSNLPTLARLGVGSKKEHEWTYEQKVKLVEILKELNPDLQNIASKSKSEKENLLKLDRMMESHEDSHTVEIYEDDDGYTEEYYEFSRKYLDIYTSIENIINFKSALYDLVFQICKDLNKL